MASNSGMFSSIERLKGRDNYDTWKFMVQAFFEHEDLWKCVEGSETDGTKNIKAKTKLILLTDPINHSHIKSAKSAKEIWDNLQSAFEDNGLTRRVGLLRTLITTKLSESSTVESYVNQIINTAYKLKSVGMDISDEWIGTLLLAGLPDEYKPMIMGLESSGIKITADAVKTKILQDVKDNTIDSNETAMFGKNKFSKRSSFNKKSVRCYECNGFGHYAKECRAKKQNGTASLVLFGSSCLMTNSNISNDWFIDSGATAHMTTRKDLLQNIANSPVKQVVVADSRTLDIECVGDMKLKVASAAMAKTPKYW